MPDASELASTYRRHAPAVFRRARQLLGLEADAYEVVQDVFLMLLEKPEQFQGRSALTTYLYSATTHTCLNRIRNSRNRERLQREHLAVFAGDEIDPVLSPEQRLILQRALLDLPDDVAQAAVYHLVDGLTHEEISQLLGCSRRHVGNLLLRASSWGQAREVTPC